MTDDPKTPDTGEEPEIDDEPIEPTKTDAPSEAEPLPRDDDE
jgi:hypothetical protein